MLQSAEPPVRPASTCDVCAVVVSYHPDPALLPAMLARVAPQVGRLLLIDNATRDPDVDRLLRGTLPANCLVERNAVNQGLGAAFNRGARWAGQHGGRFVLLLDQDSDIAADMVARLLEAHDRMVAEGPIAALGPCFVDGRSGRNAPFVRIGFPFNQKLGCDAGAVVACDFLISSGSLIPLAAFAEIGGMDESLFIDNIDIEWCFRATARGYRLYGVGAARMQHRIGDRLQRLPFGLGEVIVHSPLRLYYMSRNRVLLYRRPQTPGTWVAQDVPRLLFKFLRLCCFVAPRARNARAMLAGARDGWRGVDGPAGRVID